MFPIYYGDADGKVSPSSRPLLSLPGMDYDSYPEIEADGGLERFSETEGCWQIPFPLGLPYMDYAEYEWPSIDGANLSLQSGQIIFPLENSEEYFFLESITLKIPQAGAYPPPWTNPSGAPSPVPLIQVSSSDPNRRRGRYSMAGPEMFHRPIPANHICGVLGNGVPGGFRVDYRRMVPFSPLDRIVVDIKKQADPAYPADFANPRWIGVGIQGRMVAAKFLQGVIL